jgi:hypothetical protein
MSSQTEDTLIQMMSYLTENEITQVSLTNKQWNSSSNDEILWKEKLSTLLSTTHQSPKNLNWKQEYINKSFLLNTKTKVNPNFYNEITRQANKHNPHLIPDEWQTGYIQNHVCAKKFSCFTYYSYDVPGFGQDGLNLYFIEYQNKLFRLFENFTGIRYKEVDPKNIIFHNDKKYIMAMEEYGEIVEKMDFKSIIHNEIFELISKSFSSVVSLSGIIQFLFFLNFNGTEGSFSDGYTTKNLEELYQFFKDIPPREYGKQKKESMNENIVTMGENGKFSIEFGIFYLMYNPDRNQSKIVLKNLKYDFDEKDFQFESKESMTDYL